MIHYRLVVHPRSPRLIIGSSRIGPIYWRGSADPAVSPEVAFFSLWLWLVVAAPPSGSTIRAPRGSTS
jgi:hypothetical protein